MQVKHYATGLTQRHMNTCYSYFEDPTLANVCQTGAGTLLRIAKGFKKPSFSF